MLKLPNFRRTSAKLSSEDLKQKTAEAMKQSGASNHLLANYHVGMLNEIYAMDDLEASWVINHPQFRDQKTWRVCYQIAFNFLKSNGMENTLTTMRMELPQIGTKLAEVQPQQLEKLLDFGQKYEKPSFALRLADCPIPNLDEPAQEPREQDVSKDEEESELIDDE